LCVRTLAVTGLPPALLSHLPTHTRKFWQIWFYQEYDNVVPWFGSRRNRTILKWQLDGFAWKIQSNVFEVYAPYESSSSKDNSDVSQSVFTNELWRQNYQKTLITNTCLSIKSIFESKALNRPIRVWNGENTVRHQRAGPFLDQRNLMVHQSLQILETAQTWFEWPESQAIWMPSTHFNPVDFGLRNKENLRVNLSTCWKYPRHWKQLYHERSQRTWQRIKKPR